MTQSPELLDPEALANVDFAVVRRGYSPDQVDSVLQQAAAAIAAAQRRMAELTQEVEDLREREPTDPADLDDNELMLRLGEKTARVLEAARESAAELEQKSQDRASATVARAKEEALRIRSEAERVMRDTRGRLEALEKETERKVREQRHAAEADADRLRTQAEDVLRSARADAHALEQEATARAESLTQEATENAARARAKVEALLTTTRTQVESTRAGAEEEAARLRHEAVEETEARLAQAADGATLKLAEAEARAERIAAQAEAAYEERVALGRQRGRELIAEAEGKRAEVLRQLASTRQRAQLNLEQLRVGRERLLAAYEVARATIEQATGELDRALPEAKVLAERLAVRVGDDEARSLQELEAEFALERLQDLRVLADDDPGAQPPPRPVDERDVEEADADREAVAAQEAPEVERPAPKVFDMEAAEAEARAEAEAHDGGAHAALAHDGGAHDGGAHDADVSAVLAGDQPGDLDPERGEPDDLVAAADDGDEGDEEVLDLTDDAVVATPVAAESRHGEAG
jgi:DivIVA domain-containing protein